MSTDRDLLAVHPCQGLCAWRPSRAERALWVCTGCGSQWEPGQQWTPVDADGRVPEGIHDARRTTSQS